MDAPISFPPETLASLPSSWAAFLHSHFDQIKRLTNQVAKHPTLGVDFEARLKINPHKSSALSRLNFGVVEPHGPLGPRLSLLITKPWAERPTGEFSITCNPKI